MKFKVEMKGNKINNLFVLEDFIEKDKSGRSVHYCKCLCVCGKIVNVSLSHLKTGHTKSCGCLHTKMLKERLITHNQTDTRLYNIYCGMKYRCYTKTSKRYKDYGGRGIVICDEWKNDFLLFKKWAEENGYNENLTIDRIDVNGNYEPNNCRWITNREQQFNKRNNVYYFIKGEKLTVTQIERKYGIERHKLRKEMLSGKTIEQIIG